MSGDCWKICGIRIREEDERTREAAGLVCRNPSYPVTERIYSLASWFLGSSSQRMDDFPSHTLDSAAEENNAQSDY